MQIKSGRQKLSFLACLLALSLASMAALAQETPVQTQQDNGAIVDILPAQNADERGIVVDEELATHPPINMTPDKSELIRLDQKASSVIVGNSAHLNILPESSTLLVLVPKAPGATFFSVLDENKNVIMQRHVIVSGPHEKYVRIRKSCAGKRDCAETQVYYCPDMCHEIILNPEQKGKSDTGGAAATEKKDENAAEAAPAEETAPAKDENTEGTTEE